MPASSRRPERQKLFALLHQDKPQERAISVLYSLEYTEGQELYSNDLKNLAAAMEKRARRNACMSSQNLRLAVYIVVFIASILFVTWFFLAQHPPLAPGIENDAGKI